MPYQVWSRITLLSFFLFFVIYANASFANTKVKSLVVSNAHDEMLVLIKLDSKVEYKTFRLHRPERLVIDLKRTKGPILIDTSQYEKTPIKKIRYAKRNSNDLRLVLDLAKPLNYQSKLDRNTIVIRFNKSKAVSKPVAMATQLKPRDFVIAIDPGHGGEDPGAIGSVYKTQEKDVVMQVARKLAKRINRKSGMKAILIRDGDYFVGLRKRMQLARSQHADLFISLHADSFHDSSAQGASVFILSERGASSEAASWLAVRENRSDLIGGISLEDKSTVLASVLLDLSQTASMAASTDLGEKVVNSIGKITKLHSTTVQSAGFAVLKSPDIPSILVELGFISNKQGEKSLKSHHFQQKMVNAIFTGIEAYVAKRPKPMQDPSGSLYMVYHKVGAGETLSDLNAQYGVAIEKIKHDNHLHSNVIRTGQTLMISAK